MDLRRAAALCLVLAAALVACADAGLGDGATAPAAPTTPARITPAGTPTEASPDVRQTELAIAEAVNDERRAEGLEPLESRDDLARVAREYSRRMLEENFFDHVGPGGDTVADRVREAGISFTAVGENLYQGEGPVDHVETAVSGWMQSPGHRENILRDVFTQTGVGLARDGNRVIVTQIFLTP